MTAPRCPLFLVGAVWRPGDDLTLVRHGHGAAAGTWTLPEAMVRAGETMAEAVVRAMADDVGVDAVCGPFIGMIERTDAEPPSVQLCFEAVVLDPQTVAGTPSAASDAIEAQTLPPWKVTDLRLADGVAEFLSEHGLSDVVA